ncbi:hypothetical protein [Desulfosporosinus acidiphilus]|nr:hypothetical protein [Desulfosporosinus acidiphilus]
MSNVEDPLYNIINGDEDYDLVVAVVAVVRKEVTRQRLLEA